MIRMSQESHTQLIDAVDVRVTTRKFDDDFIDENFARQLRSRIDAFNLLSGLHIQLAENKPSVFEEANASGHYTNAAHFIALVGPKDDDESKEKAGFYGERIVLDATLTGLATAWVGGSWNKSQAEKSVYIEPNEELYLGIVIGYASNHEQVMDETYENRCEFQQNHRESKSLHDVLKVVNSTSKDGCADVPEWVTAGVTAALKAPSARNRQPVTFVYDAQTQTISAQFNPEASGSNGFIDLGIAKMHFQIGVGHGSWNWGNGAQFTR